jgi:phosphopentomutase
MVSGVDITEHGLNFNSFKPERGTIQRPTIFSVAHAAGLPTQMFVGKTKLKHLLAHKSDAEFNMGGMRCDKLLDRALPQLREARRGIVFLHFADPDSAGHRVGWMTDDYLEATQRADTCLDRVIDTIAAGGHADRTLLLVTADHGGHNRSHGTRLDVDQRIPWFAWGAGVRRGRFARPVNTIDTAATVLSALGLALPPGMRGQPVIEAFSSVLGPTGLGLLGDPLDPDSL